MSSGAPDEPAGPRSSAGRRQWYLAAGIVAGVALLGGTGAALLTVSPAPVTHALAAGCGLVTCGARLPASVTGRAVPNAAPPAPHRPGAHRLPPVSAARAHTRTPRPASVPQAPPSPSPPPRPARQPAGPQVSVTYTLDGDGQWGHGFRAHLTIVNGGHRTIAGWTIRLTLPRDHVSWVGYPGAWLPFATWQFSRTTLTLHADSTGETLSPGGTEVVPIFGHGDTTAPSGCTFNDSGCQP